MTMNLKISEIIVTINYFVKKFKAIFIIEVVAISINTYIEVDINVDDFMMTEVSAQDQLL